MRKRQVVAVVVLALVIGVAIGGGAVAATFTAPKDHAQAVIHRNNLGQFVADHQKGFLDVNHPSTGIFCFLLPANSDPAKAILEVQQVGGSLDATARWIPGSYPDVCPTAAYQLVGTFRTADQTAVDTEFSVVVP